MVLPRSQLELFTLEVMGAVPFTNRFTVVTSQEPWSTALAMDLVMDLAMGSGMDLATDMVMSSVTDTVMVMSMVMAMVMALLMATVMRTVSGILILPMLTFTITGMDTITRNEAKIEQWGLSARIV